MSKKLIKKPIVFLLLFLIINFQVKAQAFDTMNPAATTGAFDMTDSPQWARDLRRGSIVAFGSFPFTFFFTTFFMDTSRLITNDFDQRYAPWPFKPAGAIDMTREQQMMSIGIAAASSIVIALIDHLIVRSNRSRQSQEIRIIEPEPPLIIRTPIIAIDEVWEHPIAEDQPLEELLDLEEHIETEVSLTEADDTEMETDHTQTYD